jgi:hypothetical protein
MRRPGFTIIEVVIVTLFITFCYYTGTWGYNWYVRSSHASAAEAFIAQLITAQEAYQKKRGSYLPIHTAKLDAYPKEMPAEGAVIEALPKEFLELGVTKPESPFFFRVAVLAGMNEPPSAELLKDSALEEFNGKGGPWFYIVAFADQDGDGELSKLEASSWDKSGVVTTARTE